MRKLLLVLLTASLSYAETYLVCAGVEKYDDPGISPLRYTIADVTAVAEVFRAAGIPDRNLTVLTTDQADPLQRPSASRILFALQMARERAVAGDTVVFMFSGHGMEKGDESYLLTVESNRALLERTALAMSSVNEMLRGLQASHLLLIIDACRNNPDAGKSETSAALDESFAKGMRPKMVADANGQIPQAALLLACDVGERAWEHPGEGHGAFTWALLSGLRGKAGDEDGAIRLNRLADYVSTEVRTWTARARRQQHPKLDNPGGADFVVLKPGERPAAPGQPTQPTQPTGPQVDIVRREGTLEITTTLPVVSVEVNGQPAGQVRAGQPLRQKRLIGRVTVRGAAAGHVPLEQPVEVSINQTATVKLDLLRLPGLKIESELPGVTVEVDGVGRGQAGPGAPVTVEELTVGEHRVRVSLPGRAPSEQTVTLTGGRTESLKLTPLPFPTLTIEVEEEGVTVLLDGQALGELSPATPAVVRNVLPGEHKITARKGGEERVETVSLTAGKDHTLTAWWSFRLPDYLARWKDQMPRNLRFRVAPKDGMPQVLVPAGEFLMGSSEEEQAWACDERRKALGGAANHDRFACEGPHQRVYVSVFWMDLHEVTVGQYQRFCQATGRKMDTQYNKDDRHPVVMVTWDEASAYAAWAGRELPTEAQWEKAARGGTTTAYPWGECWDDSKANNGRGTKPVGSYAPNGLGLFDMSGNVYEWCRDWYDEGWYARMPGLDPCNTTQCAARVLRGGSFGYVDPRDLRAASRLWNAPGTRHFYYGFRGAAGAAHGS